MTDRSSIKGKVSTRGTMRGKNVPRTAPGRDGLSAYEVAVKNGFKGTESEWLASLSSANPEIIKESVNEYLEKNPIDAAFTTDETLTLKGNVLSVNRANAVEQDNTLPITAAAVFTTVGNIEALLKNI